MSTKPYDSQVDPSKLSVGDEVYLIAEPGELFFNSGACVRRMQVVRKSERVCELVDAKYPEDKNRGLVLRNREVTGFLHLYADSQETRNFAETVSNGIRLRAAYNFVKGLALEDMDDTFIAAINELKARVAARHAEKKNDKAPAR